MYKAVALLGSLCALSVVSSQAVPAPGAVSASVSVASLNNIANVFVPILSYYMINNKTIQADYVETALAYKLEIDQVHIDTFDGFQQKQVAFIPGTNTLRVLFSGININMDIVGSIYALHIIPFHTSHANITNVTVQMDLAISTQDQVSWQLLETTILSVQDVAFTMESSFLNWLISWFHDVILNTIAEKIPTIEAMLKSKVDAFNAQMRTANATTFMVNPLNDTRFPLNITTTKAPLFDAKNNLIDLHLDGLFYDTLAQTTHVTANQKFPPRYAGSHSEQIFVHESTLNSLFHAASKSKMPLLVKDPSLSAQVKQLLNEIAAFYGQDCNISISASLTPQSGSAIKVDKVNGFVVGANDDVIVNIIFNASNATTPSTLAAEFQMDFKTVANVTWNDFIVYLHVNAANINNTKIVKDNVGLYDRDYNQLFKTLVNSEINSLNNQYKNGFDLRTLDSNVGFIAGMFTNSTVTAYQEDGFVYAGFTFFIDAPSSVPTLQAAVFNAYKNLIQ